MADVLIAGGGIGGLTAALCLARRGHAVRLFERAPAIAETGAGLQLSPNATRVLHDLGLQQALGAVAFVPQCTEMRHWRSGRLIGQQPLGETVRERYGHPYLHVHRADLVHLLEQALGAEPRVRLQVGAQVDGVHQDARSASVVVDGGVVSGDILIGADGIRSVVREALFGPERARFTGQVAWRLTLPVDALPAGLLPPVTGVWWGPGRHLVHYNLRQGTLVNLVCVVEQAGWTVESWTEPGDPADLRAAFEGWHPTIQQLVGAARAGALFRWALFDRPPMPAWGRGRITLLGDACHPTLPFLAQGAAMAIEDAAVLAACLSSSGDAGAALARYARLRRPRTAAIQRGSRRNATVFHLSGVPAWLRDRVVGWAVGRSLDRLYRYDALRAADG
ncbi:MAG: FAD-dependent monooxygenase [Aquabacterium sp.]